MSLGGLPQLDKSLALPAVGGDLSNSTSTRGGRRSSDVPSQRPDARPIGNYDESVIAREASSSVPASSSITTAPNSHNSPPPEPSFSSRPPSRDVSVADIDRASDQFVRASLESRESTARSQLLQALCLEALPLIAQCLSPTPPTAAAAAAPQRSNVVPVRRVPPRRADAPHGNETLRRDLQVLHNMLGEERVNGEMLAARVSVDVDALVSKIGVAQKFGFARRALALAKAAKKDDAPAAKSQNQPSATTAVVAASSSGRQSKQQPAEASPLSEDQAALKIQSAQRQRVARGELHRRREARAAKLELTAATEAAALPEPPTAPAPVANARALDAAPAAPATATTATTTTKPAAAPATAPEESVEEIQERARRFVEEETARQKAEDEAAQQRYAAEVEQRRLDEQRREREALEASRRRAEQAEAEQRRRADEQRRREERDRQEQLEREAEKARRREERAAKKAEQEARELRAWERCVVKDTELFDPIAAAKLHAQRQQGSNGNGNGNNSPSTARSFNSATMTGLSGVAALDRSPEKQRALFEPRAPNSASASPARSVGRELAVIPTQRDKEEAEYKPVPKYELSPALSPRPSRARAELAAPSAIEAGISPSLDPHSPYSIVKRIVERETGQLIPSPPRQILPAIATASPSSQERGLPSPSAVPAAQQQQQQGGSPTTKLPNVVQGQLRTRGFVAPLSSDSEEIFRREHKPVHALDVPPRAAQNESARIRAEIVRRPYPDTLRNSEPLQPHLPPLEEAKK